MGSNQRVMVDNILDFLNHAEAIIGYELDGFGTFIKSRFSRSRSIHTFSFNKLKEALSSYKYFIET